MKVKTKIYRKLILTFSVIILGLCSCGSLEQWSQGLQAVGNSLSGASYYNSTPTYYSPSSSPATTSKEWHNCSQCNGTGRCKYCGGSGHDDYTKNKKCGVCRGTGKCAGCNGKGGWKI